MSIEMPGRSGALISMRDISCQLRFSRTVTGTKLRRRFNSRSTRRRSASLTGMISPSAVSTASALGACSAFKSTRKFWRLTASGSPNRSSTRPRDGGNRRIETRFSSAMVRNRFDSITCR
jgi:hypothetical protein